MKTIIVTLASLIVFPLSVHADCIDRGVDGVKKVLDFLYVEMGSPEPSEANMDKLTKALFIRDRDAEPKIDNDITVSYSESEGGVNGGVTCLFGEDMVVQPFRWEPGNDLVLEDRYTP
jgi:hypothetical protein